MKKHSGFEIRPEERQSWISIAFVWIGSVICVPALMIGGMLGAGLTLGELFAAILIGYALICTLMIFMGILLFQKVYFSANKPRSLFESIIAQKSAFCEEDSAQK